MSRQWSVADPDLQINYFRPFGPQFGLKIRGGASPGSATDSSLSECRTLKCGIPQGTMLGPLLFLRYIKNLPNCLSHSEPRMYADDTHLTYSNGIIHSVFPKVEKGACGLKTKLLLLKVTLRDSLHPECAEQLVQNNWWLAVEALVDGS